MHPFAYCCLSTRRDLIIAELSASIASDCDGILLQIDRVRGTPQGLAVVYWVLSVSFGLLRAIFGHATL